jgi:hypothetical protein
MGGLPQPPPDDIETVRGGRIVPFRGIFLGFFESHGQTDIQGICPVSQKRTDAATEKPFSKPF